MFILCFSLVFYWLRVTHIVNSTTWCPELIGFIWGSLLATHYNSIFDFIKKRWIGKVLSSCLLALVLGILYLKFKSIFFWGDYILKILLGFSILTFVLILNCKIKIGNKIILFLGDISFEVYLIHGFVFRFIGTVFTHIGSGEYILLSLFGTVISACVVNFICNMIYMNTKKLTETGIRHRRQELEKKNNKF